MGTEARKSGEIDYRLMVDSIKDAEVIMLDRDGIIRSWNSGAQALKGYSADEVIGKSVEIFYTDEDRRTGLAARELETAVRTGRFEFEGWRVGKAGKRFLANVTLQPM